MLKKRLLVSFPSILESEQLAQRPRISVLGLDVPPPPSGRRQWPANFKIEIQRKLAGEEMTSRRVARACRLSTKTVYRWRRFPPRKPGSSRSRSVRKIDNLVQARSKLLTLHSTRSEIKLARIHYVLIFPALWSKLTK